MTPADFETFATLVRQRSGLIVTADKAYLFESRLTPLLRTWNMTELSQLAEAVRMRRDEAIMRQITESMTTNESFFFRDNGQYEQLKKTLLPEFLKARATRKKLRIWSAACSSGQEAYSLGMLWLENAPLGWSIEILGTDLSAAMVDRARQGVYTQFEVQRGLPVTHLMRHFTQVEEGQWQVSEALRDIANFQEGNLVAGPHPAGPFDVIFCRNVLIYFDAPTKTRVLDGLAASLAPDGALFLGGAESVLGLTERLRQSEGERGCYRLAQKEAMRA